MPETDLTNGALPTFLFGVFLIFISFVFLIYNEIFRTSKNDMTLSTFSKTAVDVPADTVNRENNGKTVVVSGQIKTEETLSDGIVSVPNAVALKRTVEMYQWVEHRSTHRSHKHRSTSYSYKKQWSSFPENSDRFARRNGHENPSAFPLSFENLTTASATLGGFHLYKPQIERMQGKIPYADIPDTVAAKGYVFSGGFYYPANEPRNRIGSHRIRYSYIPSGRTVTVAATQSPDGRLTDGRGIFMVYDGRLDKAAVLNNLKKEKLTVWLYRLGCLLTFMLALRIINRAWMKLMNLSQKTAPYAVPVSSRDLFLRALSLSLGTAAIVWMFIKFSIGLLLAVGGAACWKTAKRSILQNIPPELRNGHPFKELTADLIQKAKEHAEAEEDEEEEDPS